MELYRLLMKTSLIEAQQTHEPPTVKQIMNTALSRPCWKPALTTIVVSSQDPAPDAKDFANVCARSLALVCSVGPGSQ